ncbi:predicted protein [Chaetoceros tenuissimus]|uniref:Uncharacterized protein n=1 Tax=Chaetoceros tenuissimus TaxID=426638 RepID=A0AAD3CWY2_9STRA|nr:predicted protein [Chaetoceros tenuissimus]
MKFSFLKKIKSCKKADKDVAEQAPPVEPSPSDDSGVYVPKTTPEEQVVAGEITVEDEIIGIEVEDKAGTKWLFESHVVSIESNTVETEEGKEEPVQESKWKPFDKSTLASIHESGVPVTAYTISSEGTLQEFTEEEEEKVMTHFVADTSEWMETSDRDAVFALYGDAGVVRKETLLKEEAEKESEKEKETKFDKFLCGVTTLCS